MALAVDVVKRSGRRPTENFHFDKLMSSLRAACLSVRVPEGEAETAAARTTRSVVLWVNSKPAVTSGDIHRVAGFYLNRYQPDAAYYYLHRRRIL